jgi:phosphatidylglycerol phospholipase C
VVLTSQQTDNNADDVMRLIARTLKEGSPLRPWSERILLGFWIVSIYEQAIFHTPT